MSNKEQELSKSPAIPTTPTLVIFCKRPKLHQGKQRLAQESSAEYAFALAKALLACAIEDARAWQGPVVIACSDQRDLGWANSLLDDAQVVSQLPPGCSGNLGQRINHVDDLLRSQGHEQLLIIGTDAPTLGLQHLQQAESILNDYDIALSHADDGGVILMANRKPWPELSQLPWSSQDLSAELAQIAIEQRLSVKYGLPGYDIDHLIDVQKLQIDLQVDLRPARQALLKTINQISFSTGAPHAQHC